MPQTSTLTRLQSRKNALDLSRLQSTPLPALTEGEVTLQIRRFAITTNNVTYLTFGEAPIHYWSFFPSGDAAWAQMPVWGFADVVESELPGVALGERFYGFFPIASHLRLRPIRISPRGFFDGLPHRRDLTSAYNLYTRCSTDPAYALALENYQALLRPLFVTSWMAADFLLDNQFFGAKRIVVSSASSKTGYGTAHCLAEHPEIELIALTSASNRDYVESLGCYAKAVAYEELCALPTDQPTLYLDFSGDADLRARVHSHFGTALVYNCLIGFTQTTQMMPQSSLEGPQPSFFFAPEQIRKRTADWGTEGYNQRFNAAQSAFIGKLSAPDNDWMKVVEHAGIESAQTLVSDLVSGRMNPRVGHIVRLTD